MLEACSGAFAFLKASPRRVAVAKTVVQRVMAGLRFWKRERRRGRDEGAEGAILGAQVACFSLMKQPRAAIAFARRHGFAVQRVRRSALASGDWADRAFSDEDLRRGGVDWIKGGDETPAPEGADFHVAWDALKRIGRSISQVFLPFKRAFTSLQHRQWLRERGVTDLIWEARWGPSRGPSPAGGPQLVPDFHVAWNALKRIGRSISQVRGTSLTRNRLPLGAMPRALW